ncbi:hypothetical protein AB6A40_010337 [Gnathostoma spinigerum]|uniref:Calsyntenin C-terminal domain-containing protein n=1 Tax=Gnathostoma spinigerum TaxID=75299 RepID=A0ABD6EUZ6_9BILA
MPSFGNILKRFNSVCRCGIHADTVVLLNDTNVSGKYDGTIGEVNLFNGISNSITVPEGLVRNPIPTRFTFSFSMQHNRDTEEELNTKQNILCESDDYGMSRHHFAVYIRHCKLEMLMRRESNAEAAFRPAEWRWSLPQVCDGRWHTYSILFASVDQVDLYVDGTRFLSSTDNPEILDDWPLHRTKTTRTRLVIGACWHGRTQTTSQYFKGRIAAMLYLPGKIEEPQSLSCVQQCKEMLQFNAMDELVPGEAAIFDNDSSVLTLRANTPEDLSLLLQKVVYINSLETPTPGHRTFDINTSVHCAEQKTLELLPSKGYIFVQKEADPVLSLSGVSVVNSEQHLVKTGAPMLAGIKITVTQNIDDGASLNTSLSLEL